MMAALFALSAAAGVWLLSFPKRAASRPSASRRRQLRAQTDDWLRQAGLSEVSLREFGAVVGALFVVGAVLGYAMTASPIVTLVAGGLLAAWPVAHYRRARRTRRERAQEAWPRLIEEIRIQTGSVGRSIPQAVLEVGIAGPDEMRPAFEAARREWVLTTDFERTVAVLKRELADPTADAACETLLVAHQLGGSDLGRRLEALAEDRMADVQARKDARSRQTGVQFARRFVLLVPVGMALAGMSLGTGRRAYQSASGQLVVLIAVAMVAACWMWSGRLLRLPDEDRVFP